MAIPKNPAAREQELKLALATDLDTGEVSAGPITVQFVGSDRGYGFLPIPHTTILDRRLGWDALGALIWMLGMRHDGRALNEDIIRARLGRDADAILSQLEALGYVTLTDDLILIGDISDGAVL